MTRKTLGACFVPTFALVLLGAVSTHGNAAEPVPSEAHELFHAYCSVCHGDKGDGQSRARNGLDPPPRDFTTPGLRERLTREQMIATILNGKPGTAMVGWKTRLSAQQAAEIADYIRDMFMPPFGKGSAGDSNSAVEGGQGEYARPGES